MSQHQKPQILSRKKIASSRLFDIESVNLRFSNQQERTYERMRGNGRGAVMIVPIKDNQLLLAREYAVGSERYELGFPKGLIDLDETPMEAANRELQEEIGFSANKLTFLKELSLAPSYFSSRMHLFLAQDLTESWLEGDEPEPIEIVPWALSRWDELLTKDDFSESRCISALFLAQKYLKQRK